MSGKNTAGKAGKTEAPPKAGLCFKQQLLSRPHL